MCVCLRYACCVEHVDFGFCDLGACNFGKWGGGGGVGHVAFLRIFMYLPQISFAFLIN